MIDDTLNSDNDLVLLGFGNTNSGKTYSIIGTNISPGILPLSINYLS